MWKKISFIIILNMFIFNICFLDCYAYSGEFDCEQKSIVTTVESEYTPGKAKWEPEENQKNTQEAYDKQEYDPEVEIDYCSENPEDCKPEAPAKTTSIPSSNFALSSAERQGIHGTTYQCEDMDGNPLSGVSCDDMEIKKTADKLNEWADYCATVITIKYMDLEFVANVGHFSNAGTKMYVKKNSDLNVRVYVWDGTTNDPVMYTYELVMVNASYVGNSGLIGGVEPYFDLSNGFIPGSELYDYYLQNIDYKDAPQYGGYYHLALELTPDDAAEIYPLNDAGMHHGIRVRYSDDMWTRYFGVVSTWLCTWKGTNGDSFSVPDYNAKYHLEYYNMTESIPRYVAEHTTANTTLAGLPQMSTYINSIYDSWKDIEEKKAQLDNAEVYGGVKRGRIEIDKEQGKWTWYQHRNGEESDYFDGAQMNIIEKSYTICMGEHNCDCEDINVLCSCEDEEAGCPPYVACPDGQEECEGPVADDDPNNCSPNIAGCNEYGETKPILNSLGLSINSGGPGGVTGKGSQDYYEKYLEGSSTLLN